ncbi:MAG: hypothetical protein P1P74_11760 [Desulfuromonadales bacterium]|nr:hypothetical protein [Desulfuromonadales bacterium]
MLKPRHACCILALTLCFFGCTKSVPSEEVALVKSGTLSACPDVPIGLAIDSFFNGAKWASGIGADGESKGKQLVNVEGEILFMDKPITAALQFVVDGEQKSFELHAMEFNGVPQNQLFMAALVRKICGEYATEQTGKEK